MRQGTAFGLVAIIFLIALVIQSGVLWLAIPAGLIAAGASFYFSRNPKGSAITGALVVGSLALLGAFGEISPDWYKTLL